MSTHILYQPDYRPIDSVSFDLQRIMEDIETICDDDMFDIELIVDIDFTILRAQPEKARRDKSDDSFFDSED